MSRVATAESAAWRRSPAAASGQWLRPAQTRLVWRVANACASPCGLMAPWNMMAPRKKQKLQGDMPHLQKNMSNKVGKRFAGASEADLKKDKGEEKR